MIPALHTQRQIWLVNRMQPGSMPAYVKENFVELTGPLDLGRLQRAISYLVACQPALRATLASRSAALWQEFRPAAPVELRLHESKPESWRALTEALFDRFASALRLDVGPLCEWHVIRLGPEHYVLFYPVHHAIWDAQTSNLFFNDLCDVYAADREECVPEVGAAYAALVEADADYCGSAALREDAVSWARTLPSTYERPAFARAPTDPASFQVRELRAPLDAYSIARLKDALRGFKASPFVVFASAVAQVLRYFARADESVLTTVLAGRERALSRGAYGCFVNHVIVSLPSHPEQTFQQAVRASARRLVDAARYQQVPLDELYRHLDPSYREQQIPLLLNFKDLAYSRRTARGVTFTELEVPKRYMDYALNLNVVRAKDYELRFEYNPAQVSESFVQRWSAQLLRLFPLLLGDSARPMRELAFDEPASVELKAAFNQPRSAFAPASRSLFESFAELTRAAPTALAFRDGEDVWDRRRLLACAAACASALGRAQVRPGDCVAIRMPRGAACVAAMLGVNAVGATFLPIDIGQPAARVNRMLAECRVRVGVGSAEPALANGDGALEWVEVEPAPVAFDDERSSIDGGLCSTTPSAPAEVVYVLYTSGSSGVPKGVRGTALGLWNRLEWQWRTLPFEADEVCCHKTALAWVDSMAEVFAPLLSGVPLVTASDLDVRDASAFLDLLETHRVTRLIAVPSFVRVLSGAPHIAARLRSLRHCTLSGEALSGELAEQLQRALPHVQFLNLYGMTECAGDSTYHVVAGPQRGPVPLGIPIANTEIHVLDERLEPCPVETVGEICIAGAGLSAGYVDQGKEADRFVNVVIGGVETRVYRTSDLGLIDERGLLIYKGRRDREIKLRGVRVNPSEVEAAARALPGVRDAAAVATAGSGVFRLFYETRRGAVVLPAALRAHLGAHLPAAFVPSACVLVDALPRVVSGKLDFTALAALPVAVEGAGEDVEAVAPAEYRPRDHTEDAVARAWAPLLGMDRVPLDRTFYELGGNSIQALEVAVQLEREHGFKVAAHRLVMRTVQELAGELRTNQFQRVAS